MIEFLHHPIVIAMLKGAGSGAVSAAWIDLLAFKSWKCWHDAAVYDWSTASWRWFQGAVVGALTAAGFAAI